MNRTTLISGPIRNITNSLMTPLSNDPSPRIEGPFKLTNSFHKKRLHTSHQNHHKTIVNPAEELRNENKFLKQENHQLNDLNRKLTEDLMRYTYKDTLKEAQYILEG